MKHEPQATSVPKTPKSQRIARLSIFSALCVIGSFIHPPSPIQSVAFDSFPGFFAALYFGALDGALVCGIGHIITALINGFPLGVSIAGGATGLANKAKYKWGFVPATLIGVAINTALFPLGIPLLGWTVALTLFAPTLLLAATLNGIIAALVYFGVRGKLKTR